MGMVNRAIGRDRSRNSRAVGALLALALAAGASACRPPAAPPSARPAARPGPGSAVIKNVIVCCQENRTLDHYYGTAPFIGAYGIPAGYTQPCKRDGAAAPYRFTVLTAPDPSHKWEDIHREWNGGRMDGFCFEDGRRALGYFTASDLPFYYGLFETSTLCVNYFCSVLGPTDPNRLYLVGGTAGGRTSNNIPRGSMDYPIILDLLERYGITWKVYSLGDADIATGGNNHFQFFKRWFQDPRVNDFTADDFLTDLAAGTLPQAAFIVNSNAMAEHPPANVRIGMGYQRILIGALRASRYWDRAVYILTYDEGGGYFDHVPPPVLDAYGAGLRVPTWIVSKYAKPANLQATLYEHASVLKFIEAVYGLPTLASVNHQFDRSTPAVENAAAQGRSEGPPAPPRDNLKSTGNLTECLTAF